jgi:hypothetical protein
MSENYYNNELISSILEAKADKIMADKLRGQGKSEEEVRKAVESERNKRRFGKDYEGATEQRRKYPFRSKSPSPETAKEPLTGREKGGMKRSLKKKQADRGSGGSKVSPIPEPKSQDRQDEGVEKAVRLRHEAEKKGISPEKKAKLLAASKKESDKVSASRERREEVNPQVMQQGFIRGNEGRRAAAARKAAAAREDSSNLTYNDVLSILLERNKKNKAEKDAVIAKIGRTEDATKPKTPEEEENLKVKAKKAAMFGTEVKGQRPEVGVQAGTKRGVEAIQRNLGRRALRNR